VSDDDAQQNEYLWYDLLVKVYAELVSGWLCCSEGNDARQ
jgi:hypothetical protein